MITFTKKNNTGLSDEEAMQLLVKGGIFLREGYAFKLIDGRLHFYDDDDTWESNEEPCFDGDTFLYEANSVTTFKTKSTRLLDGRTIMKILLEGGLVTDGSRYLMIVENQLAECEHYCGELIASATDSIEGDWKEAQLIDGLPTELSC